MINNRWRLCYRFCIGAKEPEVTHLTEYCGVVCNSSVVCSMLVSSWDFCNLAFWAFWVIVKPEKCWYFRHYSISSWCNLTVLICMVMHLANLFLSFFIMHREGNRNKNILSLFLEFIKLLVILIFLGSLLTPTPHQYWSTTLLTCVCETGFVFFLQNKYNAQLCVLEWISCLWLLLVFNKYCYTAYSSHSLYFGSFSICFLCVSVFQYYLPAVLYVLLAKCRI